MRLCLLGLLQPIGTLHAELVVRVGIDMVEEAMVERRTFAANIKRGCGTCRLFGACHGDAHGKNSGVLVFGSKMQHEGLKRLVRRRKMQHPSSLAAHETLRGVDLGVGCGKGKVETCEQTGNLEIADFVVGRKMVETFGDDGQIVENQCLGGGLPHLRHQATDGEFLLADDGKHGVRRSVEAEGFELLQQGGFSLTVDLLLLLALEFSVFQILHLLAELMGVMEAEFQQPLEIALQPR